MVHEHSEVGARDSSSLGSLSPLVILVKQFVSLSLSHCRLLLLGCPEKAARPVNEGESKWRCSRGVGESKR